MDLEDWPALVTERESMEVLVTVDLQAMSQLELGVAGAAQRRLEPEQNGLRSPA